MRSASFDPLKRPRSTPLVTILAASLSAGLLAALALAGASRWLLPPEISGPVAEGGWTGRSRGWFTARGFYPADVDPVTGAPHSWTGESVRLSVPHLDRHQAYTLTVLAASRRPADQPPPTVTAVVDGTPVGSPCPIGADLTSCEISLPVRDAARAVVSLQTSPTYTPAAPNTRTLGVEVHGLTLRPASGHFTLAWSALLSLGLAVALTVAGVWLCGISGMLGAVAAALIGTAFVWLALQDGAFIGRYTDSLLTIAIGASLAGAVVAAISRLRPANSMADWPLAVGLVLAATAVKLAFFNHPLATVGDGIFQLHRAQMVHGGSYFFTSITPRPFFEFPYAIGLYVAVQPFWSHFPSELDLVHLLRGAAVVADALVGIALFVATFRQWNNRGAALLVAGLWPFARAPLEALCNSNLTNVFGQGLFGVAMGAIAVMAASGVSVGALAVAGVFLTAAYLSHFSTFSVGVPLIGLVGLTLIAGGQGRTRRAGWFVLSLGLVAVAVAYVVYYSHFTDVFRATWARIMSHETVEAAGSAIAATPLTKLQRWASGTSDDYGLPGLVLAAAALTGAVQLARERRREGLTLVLGAWLAIWIGFTLLGIFSAVQMRVNLAAAPLFVCLGAYGLTVIARGSWIGLLASGVATIAIAVNGVRVWLMCLGR